MVSRGYTEEEANAVIQENLTANLSQKGKGKGKFKGKPKAAHVAFYAYPGKGGKGKYTPTLEDRKRRLQEIKARTKCKVCGERGHWAGDSACKGKPKTANVAFIGER